MGAATALRSIPPKMQEWTVTTRQLHERLGVPLVTARRWMRTGRIPTLARLAIMVILGGDLRKIDPAWKGSTRTRGRLTLERGRSRIYRNNLRFAKQADFIEGRYVEPDQTAAPDEAHVAYLDKSTD
jgi:hypothetical protein